MINIKKALHLFDQCISLERGDYTTASLWIVQENLRNIYSSMNQREKNLFTKQAAAKHPGSTLAEELNS